MPRPCHALPPEAHPADCRACYWCASDSPEGRAYRSLWNEPEPAAFGPVLTNHQSPITNHEGPGSELKALLASLGVPACGACAALAAEMDGWGVGGCAARREEIVARLRPRYEQMGLGVWLGAVARAVATGLAFGLDLGDVAGSLLDEALRRAGDRRRAGGGA